MNDGIFGGSVFGETESLDELLDVADEVVASGGGTVTYHEALDAQAEQQHRRAERRDMLVIERLIDEWPETKDYLRAKAVARFEAEAAVAVTKLLEGVDFLERSTARFVGIVASEMALSDLDRRNAINRLGGRPQERAEQHQGRVRSIFQRLRKALRIEAEATLSRTQRGSRGN